VFLKGADERYEEDAFNIVVFYVSFSDE